jgi:hypothetical protein
VHSHRYRFPAFAIGLADRPPNPLRHTPYPGGSARYSRSLYGRPILHDIPMRVRELCALLLSGSSQSFFNKSVARSGSLYCSVYLGVIFWWFSHRLSPIH